jgi:hypothetical protein
MPNSCAPGDVNFDFVACLEPQCRHHRRRKADGKTPAPSCDFHKVLLTGISI